MIRELDDVSLTFSLWQQARQDLHAIEEELLAARRRAMVSSQDLDELDQKMAQTKAKVESLLAQALQALRTYTARGNTGI
jgi:chromosome segregation ATPase